MKTSPATRSFLTACIQRLEGADCHPVLIRNYESFPDEIGNDLDVFIVRSSLSRAYSILRSSASAQGGSIVHLHRRGYFVAVWLHFPDAVHPVHVDLYHGALTWHGLPFLGDEELISRTLPMDGTACNRIPSPPHEAMISCLASILWGGFFKSRYQDHLQRLLSDRSNFEEFSSGLERCFDQWGSQLATAVREASAASLVDPAYARKLRLLLFLKSLRSHPLQSSIAWLRHWWEEFLCYLLRLPGLVVEYDKARWNEADALRLQEILKPYFGATHHFDTCSLSLRFLLKLRRLRGKNHLAVVGGSDFRINANSLSALPSAGEWSVDRLAGSALSILRERMAKQYEPDA